MAVWPDRLIQTRKTVTTGSWSISPTVSWDFSPSDSVYISKVTRDADDPSLKILSGGFVPKKMKWGDLS